MSGRFLKLIIMNTNVVAGINGCYGQAGEMNFYTYELMLFLRTPLQGIF